MNLRHLRVKDAYEELVIKRDDITELYNSGRLEVLIPEGVQPSTFAKRCLSRIEDLLYDEYTNFYEEEPILSYVIAGNTIIFTAERRE